MIPNRRRPDQTESDDMICRPASLAETVVQTLIRALETGRLQGQLPGERKLGVMLQVSRMTLRPALQELERLGWIRTVPGQFREILKPVKPRINPVSPRRIVHLSPIPVREMEPFFVLSLDFLREMLARRSILLETETRPECYGPNFRRALNRLCAENHPDLWLLGRSTRTMQAWFLRQHHKHIVLGSAFDAKAHSAVDLDHMATARHAATTFGQKGHKRVAVFVRDSHLAGDQKSVEGFLAGAAGQAGGPLHADAFAHDGTPAGTFRAVDRLVKLQPRPTGIFSAGGLQTVAIMTRLFELGIRVPQEMSIISRDDDSALDFVTPTPARYSRPSEKFARGVFRQIERQLKVGEAPARTCLIYPEFLPKSTLASPPAG
ncbi:MAG: substrate-binding domain-containing protein [Verrucomicrobia bacterium]|nr:substrate-binding domain-containing protein [Verrucomicrobiota bacterium]